MSKKHLPAITELLGFNERLEELHIKVQGIISSPHLSTTLIYDVSQRWSQYLNRCVAALEAPGASFPFSIEPIMV